MIFTNEIQTVKLKKLYFVPIYLKCNLSLPKLNSKLKAVEEKIFSRRLN